MDKWTISENGIHADVFFTGRDSRRKTILLLGGSEGGKSWNRISQVITRLAQKGYNLVSTAYFKAPGLPDTLQEIPLEMFERVFAWLNDQPEVIPDQYAIIGGSKGAELALLLASRCPQIKAVAAISPSSVVWQGIPQRRFQLGEDIRSSWSYQGSGLPFLAYPLNGKDHLALLTLRLREIHVRALRDLPQVEEAAIPIELASGAVLLISGENDQMWPAVEMGSQLMARLDQHSFPYPYQQKTYPGGHNRLILNRDMWREVFGFLEENF